MTISDSDWNWKNCLGVLSDLTLRLTVRSTLYFTRSLSWLELVGPGTFFHFLLEQCRKQWQLSWVVWLFICADWEYVWEQIRTVWVILILLWWDFFFFFWFIIFSFIDSCPVYLWKTWYWRGSTRVSGRCIPWFTVCVSHFVVFHVRASFTSIRGMLAIQ